MKLNNGKPVRNVLTASLFVLAGAVAWIVLSAGQASAFTLSHQDATATNQGVGIANTGGNAAVGNASTNDASSNQTATANASGKGDAVAVNDSNTSNNSNGSATIVTGDANATGNRATNNTQQVTDSGGKGGFVLAHQNSDTTNTGVGIANTGFNLAAGNLSHNSVNVRQTAHAASGGTGDAVAVNSGSASNNSNGTATIITGSASAIGNHASNNVVQVIDADNSSGFVLADQTVSTHNFGLGLTNSGLNFAFGNVSSSNTTTTTQNATANSGTGDHIAVNSVTATNSSTGNALIATGNAIGVGSTSVNNNSQILDASAVRDPESSALPLMLLLLIGLFFVGTPVRRLGARRS